MSGLDSAKLCKEPSAFEQIVNELENETNRAMSVGIDIRTKLNFVKNEPTAENCVGEKEAPVNDMIQKINNLLGKLRTANTINEQNNYKLNQLF